MSREHEDEGICAALAGLKDTHHYHLHAVAGIAATSTDRTTMRAIMRELKALPDTLTVQARGSMFVRYDEDCPQYIRALLTGDENSPYASGIFVFDVYCPPGYPRTHPMVCLSYLCVK